MWGLGITCLGAFNFMSDFTLFGKNMFDLLDYATANIMLPLGGIFIAVFAGWFVKQHASKEELGLSDGVYKLWYVLVRFVAPIAVGIVFYLNL